MDWTGGGGQTVGLRLPRRGADIVMWASTFFIGLGAIGAVLARALFSLITGMFRFLIGLVRTVVAMVWVLLQAIFGRRD